MTIPTNKDELENLQKIAELNKEADDWVYSPVRREPINKPSATDEVLKRVGGVKLPKK